MAYQNPLMPQLPGGGIVPGGNSMPPPGMARPLAMQQGGPMQPPMQPPMMQPGMPPGMPPGMRPPPGMMQALGQPNTQFPLNPQAMPPTPMPPVPQGGPGDPGGGGQQGFGKFGPGMGQAIMGDVQNFRNALMDWRGQRPDFTPGSQDQFRQQLQDWRGQRPAFRDYFGNILPGGQVMTPGGGGTGAPPQGPSGQMIVNGGTYPPTPSGGAINY